jgi:enoyl-CoA hydratase
MKCVKFEIHTSAARHKVGIIKIARPEAMNALNRQVLSELRELVTGLAGKPEIRALILTGEGEKAFVAGADIKEMESLNGSEAREMATHGQALLQKIEDLPFPVVAVVNGFALGGGLELALACDFMLASTKARWGLPEVTLGLIPGYGGTQRLSRVVGRASARRIALSGEMFTAQQGYEWGLFTQVCEPVDLMPAALKLAETLASRAPLAMALAKKAVNRGHDLELARGLELEAELFGKTFETHDHNEGIKAFIEKRAPDFQGK